MKRILSAGVAAALVVSHSVTALAGNEFATIEASYAADGSLVTGTLHATAGQDPIDGEYVFEGFVIHQERAVPLEVRVPVEASEPPQVAAFQVADGSVKEVHAYEFKANEAVVSKVFFEVEDKEASGTMALTDDPLPIIGWLVIGGASVIIASLGVFVASGCEKITTKATYGVNGVSYEASCEN